MVSLRKTESSRDGEVSLVPGYGRGMPTKGDNRDFKLQKNWIYEYKHVLFSDMCNIMNMCAPTQLLATFNISAF